MATKKKTSEESSWEVVDGPISPEDIIDRVMDKAGDNFSKVDERSTDLLTEESPEVRERALEIMTLVNSGKKSQEWADTQEKYIRTGTRNRQSPPKPKDVKKVAKLPNTRGEKVVSDTVSGKPKKPQGKATQRVKKIDDSPKNGTKGKSGKNKKPLPSPEEKLEAEIIAKRKSDEFAQKRSNKFKEDIFEMVDDLALTLGKRKAFKTMSPMHMKFAAFMALPESCESLTNCDFVEHYDIGKNGPSLWKARIDVMRARDYLIYEVAKKYTPLVIKNLANSAQRKNWNTGMADAGIIKLFLQVIEKWTEKAEVEHSGSVENIFTMDIGPSQFVKRDNLPKAEKDEEGED